MRIEYEEMQPRFHAVVVVDDREKRWRTDVKVLGDVHADDGRDLIYRGLSIAGILPKPALEAVIIREFERTGSRRKDDWLPLSVFVASFVLTAAVASYACFSPSAAPVDLPAPVQADVGVEV